MEISQHKARKILRAEFGPGNYRVTAKGDIHARKRLTVGGDPKATFVLWGFLGTGDTDYELSELARQHGVTI